MRLTLTLALTGLLLAHTRHIAVTSAETEPGWTITGWFSEDPADSLYRSARSALSASNYRNAALLFRQLRNEYPKSRYAPDSYYWEAFALYRMGSGEDLREARRLLSEQRNQYPKAATRGDATTLLTRVEGQLAQRGDAEAAARVSVTAESAAPSAAATAVGAPCVDDDDDTRIAALNALLQMDAERAVPILKRVLARRDRCAEILRRKAIFLVSQHRTSETEDILLAAARSDPDKEVREQAVFWLSQVGSARSVVALDSILRNSRDVELQGKAIFALGQSKDAKAQQALRDYASQETVPTEVREQAIFWLGQTGDAENGAFLRSLFGRTSNREIKEKIIFSVSQNRGSAKDRWLLDLALNEKEDMELRKQGLFWAGQSGTAIGDLIALYDRMSDREMRDQLIFAYSQRREPAAVDKLIQIAKTDPNKELRKQAIFWLSQNKDPRAAEFLLQIIEQQ